MTQTIARAINVVNDGDPYNVIDLIDYDSCHPTDNAYPTSRVLKGSCDDGYAVEYIEPVIDTAGRYYDMVYLFAAEDIAGQIEEDYPFDFDHCMRAIRRYDDEQ